MMKFLISFYVDILLKKRPAGNKALPETLRVLPTNVGDLEREIARQDEQGCPADEDDLFRWITTRLAMAEVWVRQDVEKGEISPEEADLLRDKCLGSALSLLEGAEN